MLKVFPWGAPGKVSQLRGPLGGAPGNPGKLWGAVWFWANKTNQVQKLSSTSFFCQSLRQHNAKTVFWGITNHPQKAFSLLG